MSTTTSYSYKHLPVFEPEYYHAWASTIIDTFAEREWNNYLIPPPTTTMAVTTPAFVPNPVITTRAKAFLSQSIPLQYKSSIELFITATQIWSSFLMCYGTTTRDDELHLEQDLLE